MSPPVATRARRLAGPLLLPALALTADLAARGRRIAGSDALHVAGYAGTVVASVAIWSALVVAASSRSRARSVGAVTCVAAAALACGTQLAFFSRWNVYAGLDAVVESTSIVRSLVASLPLSTPRLWIGSILGATAAAASIALARRAPLAPRSGWRVAVALPVAAWTLAFTIPVSYRAPQTSSPDTLYFHGIRALVQARLRSASSEPRLVRVQVRDPHPVPPLRPAPARPRNVLFVLQEAQRADATCIDHMAACKLATKPSNDAAPERIGLRRVRSVGSSTALAIATLWSGLAPTARGADLHRAPLLWEYAHAAGIHTAYLTSQHLMFQNARLFVQDLPLDVAVSGTEIDPLADWLVGAPDGALSDRFLAELDGLAEPWLAVVHYSNIHKPRRIDPDDAPFTGADVAYRKEQTPAQKRFYLNAVHASDVAVAKLVRGVRAHASSERTVIVFLSDHGEGQFEHGQDNDHSGSVFDEEIHVPAWIDAPRATLSPEERASIVGVQDAWLVAYDVAPTILDLMGLWDAPELESFREKMPGQPWTRPRRPSPPLPITNVSWVWEYKVPNWGILDGPRKLVAQGRDEHYRCFDLRADPAEEHDLGEEACPDLVRAAQATFHMMPRDLGRLAERPDWGAGP